MSRLLLALAPLALASTLACGDKDDDDDDDGGGGGDGGTGGSCEDLGQATGEVAAGDNLGASDAWDASECADSGGDDLAFTWTAPSEGCWSFDTFGSSYDTALTVFDSDCGGELLSCNDDAGDGYQSQVQLSLSGGATVTVIVDAFSDADGGSFVLNVESCGEGSDPGGVTDLGSATGDAVAEGSNVGEDTSLTASCATWASDVVFSWQAPNTGSYAFTTLGSDIDTVLGLFDPSSYAELACDDDGGEGADSRIEAELMGGDEVLIGVAGYAGEEGSYQLNIEEL